MFTKFGIVMVIVSEMERSIAFYRDVLGLTLEYSSPEWASFDVGGVTLGLHPAGDTRFAKVAPEGGISFGFYVEDLDATLANLTTKGVQTLQRTTEGFGQLAIVADPDNYGIQLCQMNKW